MPILFGKQQVKVYEAGQKPSKSPKLALLCYRPQRKVGECGVDPIQLAQRGLFTFGEVNFLVDFSRLTRHSSHGKQAKMWGKTLALSWNAPTFFPPCCSLLSRHIVCSSPLGPNCKLFNLGRQLGSVTAVLTTAKTCCLVGDYYCIVRAVIAENYFSCCN